jgi:hypothetical protein
MRLTLIQRHTFLETCHKKTHALPAGMQHVADYSGEVSDGEGRQLQN